MARTTSCINEIRGSPVHQTLQTQFVSMIERAEWVVGDHLPCFRNSSGDIPACFRMVLNVPSGIHSDDLE